MTVQLEPATPSPPAGLSPAGLAIWETLDHPVKLLWVDPYQSLTDNPEALGKLLAGDHSAYDEWDSDARYEAAWYVLEDALRSSPEPGAVTDDDRDLLREYLLENDESEHLLTQLARRTSDIVVGIRLDDVDTVTDLAELLGVPVDDPALVQIGEGPDECPPMVALAAIDAEDLVRLSAAEVSSLTTLTLTDVGDYRRSSGGGWLHALGTPARVMVTVDQVTSGWIDGMRGHNTYTWWDTCGGYDPTPVDDASAPITPALSGEAGELFAALRADGANAALAYRAAVAETALAAKQAAETPRRVSVARAAGQPLVHDGH